MPAVIARRALLSPRSRIVTRVIALLLGGGLLYRTLAPRLGWPHDLRQAVRPEQPGDEDDLGVRTIGAGVRAPGSTPTVAAAAACDGGR